MGFIGGKLGSVLLRTIAPAPPERGGDAESGQDQKLERYFGPEFPHRLQGKTVIDFGCGDGVQAVMIATQVPDCRVIGLDIQPRFLAEARARAARCGVADRCHFAETTTERADVIMSIDAFEHFSDPGSILETMSELLKPGGEVMASFGPTWLHPYGGHLFSVFPWAHLIFTEAALIRWRAGFRHDGAIHFSEVEGGLNQIRIAEFERLVADSSLAVDWLESVPIRNLSFLRSKPLREFGSSIVRCRLVRRKDLQGAPQATEELAA
ncbi:methyltransferase domain-containing protein [Wenzhouxiangella sp. XN201]|uniref:class I SAM-dependent methyltransferase n=1 Tax=Wenzhouxiangella sp. XN201 TaxID=2710755 RepID=UPI0013CB5BD2|nr:class I SAM-dependent methyltransferase [Wenzhouxiangella sp. XN201]NEZ03944.1 methyltransferase domain-containing protein [Wenzhouxiangella sp. XN201]